MERRWVSEVRSLCLEVFAYDAVTGTLSCASCNPTDQRPVGASWLSVIE